MRSHVGVLCQLVCVHMTRIFFIGTMVVTRAQHAMDLYKARDWPCVYDDALVRWLHYFTSPLDNLRSRCVFDFVLPRTRFFMSREVNRYISDLTVKKRVQRLKYVYYDFTMYVEQPGVQLIAESGLVRVSKLYWEQFHGGRRVSMINYIAYNLSSIIYLSIGGTIGTWFICTGGTIGTSFPQTRLPILSHVQCHIRGEEGWRNNI